MLAGTRTSRAFGLLLVVLVGFQLFCVAASIAVHRTRPQGLIASDGKSYYAWLRSLALDGDLDFRNDYQLIYPPEPIPPEPPTPRGLIGNKYPVGVAVLEVPGFAIGHLVALTVGAPRNGVSAPYKFAVTLWLQALALTSLGLLWLALVRLGADPMLSTLGVASALLATNLVQYIARPAMPHGPGLSIVCLIVFLAASSDAQSPVWRVALLGALLGLTAIIRPSNVALAPFLAPMVVRPLGMSRPRWALFAAAFTGVVALHVVPTSILWGRLTFSGYVGEGFTSGWTGIVSTLFSSRHGLFVYHPWYLVTLLLCAAALRRPSTRSRAAGTLASFAAFALINGTWWSWWFGDSYGNRAFIELIPALVLTSVLWLGGLRDTPRRILAPAATVALLCGANAVLWIGYILRRYPLNGLHSIADAYLWWRS